MSADTDFVQDLFAGVGLVSVRRMFGGAGVYAEGVMFALVDGGGQIFVKTDEALRAEMSAIGCEPFLYTFPSGPRAGQTVGMGYWKLPEAALDDPEEASAWGRKALAVAKTKAKDKKPKKARTRRKR